uniref:SUI1 domain-containing protein n=1 Tax=Rhabditophanes sp. KR3021 TaxID=114890 RepID=A0AC35UGX6_9BILA
MSNSDIFHPLGGDNFHIDNDHLKVFQSVEEEKKAGGGCFSGSRTKAVIKEINVPFSNTKSLIMEKLMKIVETLSLIKKKKCSKSEGNGIVQRDQDAELVIGKKLFDTHDIKQIPDQFIKSKHSKKKKRKKKKKDVYEK